MIHARPQPAPMGMRSVYDLRRWLWFNSRDQASQYCLRRARANGAQLVVSGSTGRAGVRGVQRCARVWSCPTCSRAIQGGRLLRLTRAVECLDEPVMVTLTVQHNARESLRDVLQRCQDTWRKTRTGKAAWKGDYVRVLEVTEGNGGGWHPHFHVLTESRDAASLVARWLACAPGAALGAQRISPVDSAGCGEYLAGELLGSHFKGRSQWSLLARASQGDGAAAHAWYEFEESMTGARQMTWSRNLRAAVNESFDLDVDASDEALLWEQEEMPDALDLTLAVIEPDAYADMVNRASLGVLLSLADARDWLGVVGYLERYLPGGGYRLSSWLREWVHIQRAFESERTNERLF